MERPAAPDVHKAQVTACVRVRPRAPARAASRAVRDDGAGPAWLARLLAAPAVTQVTIEATGAEQVVHRVDQRRHQGGRGERAAPRCSRWVARRISSVVAQLPNSNRGHRSAGGVPSPASEGTQTSTRPPRALRSASPLALG